MVAPVTIPTVQLDSIIMSTVETPERLYCLFKLYSSKVVNGDVASMGSVSRRNCYHLFFARCHEGRYKWNLNELMYVRLVHYSTQPQRMACR
jgi:hypothetical protein